jgi:hypothetical protein
MSHWNDTIAVSLSLWLGLVGTSTAQSEGQSSDVPYTLPFSGPVVELEMRSDQSLSNRIEAIHAQLAAEGVAGDRNGLELVQRTNGAASLNELLKRDAIFVPDYDGDVTRFDPQTYGFDIDWRQSNEGLNIPIFDSAERSAFFSAYEELTIPLDSDLVAAAAAEDGIVLTSPEVEALASNDAFDAFASRLVDPQWQIPANVIETYRMELELVSEARAAAWNGTLTTELYEAASASHAAATLRSEILAGADTGTAPVSVTYEFSLTDARNQDVPGCLVRFLPFFNELLYGKGSAWNADHPTSGSRADLALGAYMMVWAEAPNTGRVVSNEHSEFVPQFSGQAVLQQRSLVLIHGDDIGEGCMDLRSD